jgi:hypothetical protein
MTRRFFLKLAGLFAAFVRFPEAARGAAWEFDRVTSLEGAREVRSVYRAVRPSSFLCASGDSCFEPPDFTDEQLQKLIENTKRIYLVRRDGVPLAALGGTPNRPPDASPGNWVELQFLFMRTDLMAREQARLVFQKLNLHLLRQLAEAGVEGVWWLHPGGRRRPRLEFYDRDYDGGFASVKVIPFGTNVTTGRPDHWLVKQQVAEAIRMHVEEGGDSGRLT